MESLSRILIIRFSSIGDIVLSSPLVRLLRARFLESRIDYVTGTRFVELIRFNTNIDRIIEYDASTGIEGLKELKKKLHSGNYDLVVDIHNSLRSRYLRQGLGAKKIVTINKRILKRWFLVNLKWNFYDDTVPVTDRYIEPLRSFGIENDGEGLELYLPAEVITSMNEKLRRLNMKQSSNILGICPSAKHFTKRWLPERFVETGVRFSKEHNGAVMIFGGLEDRDLCAEIEKMFREQIDGERVINWTGELSLLETAAAMHHCDVVLTNDTGLMHIADAMGKKVVALFGPTVEEFGFFPQGDRCVIVEQEKLSCRPCSHIGSAKCPKKHFCCMREISVDEVYEKIQAVL